ncbi:MAG: FAD:protein FMN transferase [Chthonomonadales bacterium]|nr:FAD:protein FMN transferase [Chthonomonadales bacterium]
MEELVTAACSAMATRFEIALWGGAPANLRGTAAEALAEIERLEAQLSAFRPDSDIADINARAAREPVVVEPRLFALLQRAAEITHETGGAFDITVGPLLRAWGFAGGSGAPPDPAALAAARAATGMGLVMLDADTWTVRFAREGVALDLGAIGKGYAIERAAGVVRGAGVGGALLHGGTSTVQAVGGRPDGTAWPVAIADPARAGERIRVVQLRDSALSVSAPHGKWFTQDGQMLGHVLDPRRGAPMRGASLAAVMGVSAIDSDALSTGLLVLGPSFLERLRSLPGVAGLLVLEGPDGSPRVVETPGPLDAFGAHGYTKT